MRCGWNATFRVSGKAPELWNPVTGEHVFAAAYQPDEGLHRPAAWSLRRAAPGSWSFACRRQSLFRAAEATHRHLHPFADISGSWTVSFDPKWGGPASIQFDTLEDWSRSRRSQASSIYSGTATYAKRFDLPAGDAQPEGRLFLDLGSVRELAAVKLNGKSLGVVWAPPFRVDISDTVKPAGNRLEIEVVNFWPNRIIGDQSLPEAQRLTRTNIRKLTAATPLMTSGLLGPVRILRKD